MITNTLSFETNFQALPDDIQNKIKDYVPNVRIDRASDAKFFNEVIQPKIQELPKEIQDHIKGYNPTVIVDHKSRNNLFNELKIETEQKVGLYGESLILKGLLLCDQLFEYEKRWSTYIAGIENRLAMNKLPQNSWYSPVPTLFCNALNNPTGKSEKALNGLYYINHGAAEALQQLNHISVCEKHLVEFNIDIKSNIEKNNNLMEHIRQQRTAEQTIYNACGGKDKFHDLKILPWENANDYSNYGKILEGETVMRGLDDDGCPFIAISLQKPGNVFAMLQQKGLLNETGSGSTCTQKDYDDCKLLNKITVLRQDDSTNPTLWTNSGWAGLMHSDAGDSVNEFGIKTGKTGNFFIENTNEMKYSQYSTLYNLFPTVKELLTTGSCLYDAENPKRGMFKLVKQG